ncbi:hypothetical protein [Kitasatospora sp. MBT63]|uniref:hypothetical protein n=1 Tax=Kitasatospora sp. MBT63 TaxID=1444768 RepID=UPI00053B908B|nr:hypothetical protein [Kitasatospora sp. MBT63]
MTPTLPDEPSHVRIVADGPHARLEIDGRDVASQVRAYTLSHRAGELPELALLLRPTASDGWEGLARVSIGEPPDPGPAAAAFLGAMDAGELERTVLNRHDLMDGGPGEYTRALLMQLQEWAVGKWAALDEVG